MRGSWGIVAALVCCLALGGCFQKLDGPDMVGEAYVRISADEARAMMGDDGVVVVDVRTTEEYGQGHIPGALSIPVETIGDTWPEALDDLDQEILVYCRTGRRSKAAAEGLIALGYTHVYDFGGIEDWNGEVVTDGAECEAVAYVYGRGGTAAETARYAAPFDGCAVVGIDYSDETPQEAVDTLNGFVRDLGLRYRRVTLVGVSIGCYWSMVFGFADVVDHAHFISPVPDLERLITDAMAASGVDEQTLAAVGGVRMAAGDTLSRDYLTWVRDHPVRWAVPTDNLYATGDTLVPQETVTAFVAACDARLAPYEGGEHWFRTPEQMRAVDAWIRSDRPPHRCSCIGFGVLT